jgi:histidine triad (HIT) family protein
MSDCLFCGIIRGEINSKKVFENENVFGFVDIHPQAKEHYLFIHKAHSANINEMSEEEVSQVFAGIKEFTKSSELTESGFRVVTNTGSDACQTVFHTHFHVLGGEQLSSFGR